MKTSRPTLAVLASAFALFISCHAAAAEGASASSEPLLVVKGDKLVNGRGEVVRLRGFGLGGMLHMENFIDGYPGNEEAFREVLLKAMGQKKYDLFFDTFYRNYFTEADARYIASLGLNLVRIPVNYRQFEDDMNPRVIKQEGFTHLDRVVRLCAEQRIYTIIDLHALPGYQNQHWHSDNPTHKALLWKHKDFQDRTVVLWEAIARHYRDQPWVAGYDLINEPADPTGESVVPFFQRLRDAVRKVDPAHILFIEGNTYAREFHRFDPTWKNVVYSNHDYAAPGFPSSGPYPGETAGRYYDSKAVEADFLKKSQFMIDNQPADLGRRVRSPVHGRRAEGRDAVSAAEGPARHLRQARRELVHLALPGRRTCTRSCISPRPRPGCGGSSPCWRRSSGWAPMRGAGWRPASAR